MNKTSQLSVQLEQQHLNINITSRARKELQ